MQLKLDMHGNPQDMIEIGNIIGLISKHEFKLWRPQLSALFKWDEKEGNGFYKVLQELGNTSDSRILKRIDIFATAKIRKCHDFLEEGINYQKFK